MEHNERINLRGRICMMHVGESIEVRDFPYTTVRSYCSDLGWQYGRKYSSRRNREAGTYTITRNA